MKESVLYQIFVEGGLHEETRSLKDAIRLRKQFESEGWNVRIVKLVPTIVGDMGVDV